MTHRASSGAPSVLVAVLVVATMVGLPDFARAQTTSVAFKDLSTKLKVGDEVSAADHQGGLMKGRVAEITSTSLTLTVRTDKDPRTRPNKNQTQVTLADTNTLRVTKVDSVLNGALIGAAAGAVPGLFIWGVSCECDELAAGAFLFGAAGAAAGAAIDGAFHKTVYVAGQAKKTLAVAPVLGAGRRGVTLSLRF